MTRKLFALGVAAAAMLMASSLFDPADARRGGGGGHSYSGGGGSRGGHSMSPRSFSGGSHRAFRGDSGSAMRFHRGHRHAHRHHRHRHLLFAAPFVGYGYYSYGECEWLRQRALATGSSYWWGRYEACSYGYY